MKSVSVPALFFLLFVAGCETASLTAEKGYGPAPQLPKPNPTLLPTVNVAVASRWGEGEKPTPASGFSVSAFATGLDHPRWIHVLPNGDVLVAETNKPPKEDKSFSLRGWVMKLYMARAGAEVPSANRITLLRDRDGDGIAETRSTLLEDLNSPFGMALSKGVLYVANTDAIVAFPYKEGATRITAGGKKIADLPAGPINHHWTKDVIASRDGTKLYATVGSNSNVAENGIEVETNRAAVLQIDLATGKVRLFASGLRNPNGLSWHPQSGELWVAVNERDEIGSDLVPDYMTSVKDGGFYGWPYSYFGKHIDKRVNPQRPDLVEKAIVPDYALGPHTASLGLTFYSGKLFPKEYRNGAFVGQHGSWNRRPRSGYKVVFVPFANGKPAGEPNDILTGFIGQDDKARGRPVGVAVDRHGALLVADDVGNAIWRITPSK
ncbi:PQQ-dependent sugar dehydrogenase [Ensifer canadensis]